MCGSCCKVCLTMCGCFTKSSSQDQDNQNSTNPKEENSSGQDNTSEPDEHQDSIGPLPGPRRRIRRLFCQTGFDLAIYPNGTVRGTKSPKNKFALLEFEAVGLEGHIRIKGIETQFYITMTTTGRVFAQPLAENRGTIWIETGLASGTSYHSLLSLDYAHKGYYLGLKRSGKPKEGPRTSHPYPQKATSFIQRIVSEE